MASGTDNWSSQTDIFEISSSTAATYPEFAELCNALYERELHVLATQGPTQLPLLRRRLQGLPHHIRRAAYFLARNNAPIDVDSHNASWQAKPAAKCPAHRSEPDKTAQWYSRYSEYGLVVPVHVQSIEGDHIELDSVDMLQAAEHKLHANKHGWFHMDGEPVDPPAPNTVRCRLLRPSKPIMTAACCGHTWNHKGRSSPRALSLREMLLSGNINWKTFRLTPTR
ncbi:hypothetical protein OCL06_09625 [Alteromonas sp. ASW11-19]|uniref:Uncharacterized protein n=1 Tax=Alteromonas salexigens TaxID=2982530 RepID=A0ABT2VNH6_9ALTE|nr:hypothetical protein [Alteromonas salexigens]MCU7554857.1 hypothetical protein [Alteromonas salexigens]